jgi:glycosyltransferase involved in cell wall biosynthesis
MKLSVIIPTHNRPDLLRHCLETLQAQQHVDLAALEVVVVDDGSPGDIAALVADVSAHGAVVMRCERQDLTGLNAARNLGAERSGGEVLAYLDDDTLVSPGWAAALLGTFDTYTCAAVGGRVELGLAGPAPEWLAGRRHYLAEYDLGSEPCWIECDPVPVGANCAVRRSDFERIGGFRRGLDRLGSSLVSNGDTEFFRRLRTAGRTMRYEPDARVVHRVPADRLTAAFFAKRHYAQGVSDELLLAFQGDALGWRHSVRLAGGIFDGVKALCRDLVHRRGTLNGRFEAHYWAGRLVASLTSPRVPAASVRG